MTASPTDILVEAVESIALAGMSGSGQESEEGMTAWHASRAWEFIGIAARALTEFREARAVLLQQPPAQKLPGQGWASMSSCGCHSSEIDGRITNHRCAKHAAEAQAAAVPSDALPPEVIEFDDFLNEPPENEQARTVRGYRHDAYRKWEKVLTKFRALLATPTVQPTPDLTALAKDIAAKHESRGTEFGPLNEHGHETIRLTRKEGLPAFAEELWAAFLAWQAKQVTAGVQPTGTPSAWWALVMGAAASIEDAANCLRDPDAKKQAEGAAKHYREAAQKLMAAYGVSANVEASAGKGNSDG